MAAPRPAGAGTAAQLDANAFRAAMRRLAGAVCIVASGEPGHRVGLTATAVCSITAEPPRLLVCLNKTTGTYDAIARNGVLSVNVLASDGVRLAKRFAGMVPGAAGEERFAEGRWSMLAGVPVLDVACVALACRVVEVIPASTHSMFLCDVVAVHCGTEDQKEREGLIYLEGRFRHLAPLSSGEMPLIEWIW
jgi:flavin reductase (DIM6/NTAB) family NADH-FMN oxidoreductase RutF